MKLPMAGINKQELFDTMDSYSTEDLNWRHGRTFAYVYDAGKDVEDVSKTAYMKYLSENALDPSVYPSLLRFENEIIGMASSHLGGDESIVGNFTSGGTESILLAVKAARDFARIHHPHILEPELIIPDSAHGAFHKAAHYLNINIRSVPVDSTTFKAAPNLMEEAITQNTIMIVGSAISYPQGVIDPISELAKIALKHNIWLHIDACMGGFLLPYFRRLGAPITDFDFSVPGVTSISMDLHKWAYCPKGASVILYRNEEYRKFQIYVCANWSGYSIVNPTVQSSKSGGPLAAAWATLNYIGDERYLDLAGKIRSATKQIIQGITAIQELQILGNPEMNLLSFTSNSVDIFKIIDEMKQKNWYIQPQYKYKNFPENIHLSISHDKLDKIEDFLQDLYISIKKSIKTDVKQTDKSKNKLNDEKIYEKHISKCCPILENCNSNSEVTNSNAPWVKFHRILNSLTPEDKNINLLKLANDIYKQ